MDPDYEPSAMETRTIFGLHLEQLRNTSRIDESMFKNVKTARNVVSHYSLPDLLQVFVMVYMYNVGTVYCALYLKSLHKGHKQHSFIDVLLLSTVARVSNKGPCSCQHSSQVHTVQFCVLCSEWTGTVWLIQYGMSSIWLLWHYQKGNCLHLLVICYSVQASVPGRPICLNPGLDCVQASVPGKPICLNPGLDCNVVF